MRRHFLMWHPLPRMVITTCSAMLMMQENVTPGHKLQENRPQDRDKIHI
ncbi:hypothetical protein AZ044_003096 [Pluralibacter gergoviae]|nr:hypothetical protein AZ034_001820 [Pluralibacter gergoviae]OUF56829.1 hypothetical protein AZ044_003096 [Pluralibacter gergoviae]